VAVGAYAQGSLSLTPPAADGQRLLSWCSMKPCCDRWMRHNAASDMQGNGDPKLRKQAEEDTFINQAGR